MTCVRELIKSCTNEDEVTRDNKHFGVPQTQ